MTEHDMTALLQVSGLKKIYTLGTVETQALKQVDFKVQQGEYVGIVGKSGAGKTTLLNMLGGLDAPTEGDIRIGNVHVQQLNEDGRSRWRCRTIGFIFQSFELIPDLSLLDNVILPLDFLGEYHPKESREKAVSLLEMVGLGDHIQKKPSEISGGQQQRVAIARALINDPEILLADEPTGRLDEATSQVVFDIFDRISAKGMTLLIVTHDRSLEKKFDRIIRLSDGRIVEDSGEGQS